MANLKDRPIVTLVSTPDACRAMMADTSKQYEGWCNSATWTFNIYMIQERKNYEALVDLIRKARQNGGITDQTYALAATLMEEAYNERKMEPFDGDEIGDVNVREIVDDLAAEIK